MSAIVALAALGLASRPLAERATAEGGAAAPTGGMRAALADVLWLRAHVLWEQRDAPAVMAHLRLVAAANPDAVYFWVNGARIIAHDMSAWRIEDAERAERGVDAAEIEAQQARAALRWLDAAERIHASDARLEVERASITLIRLHDVAGAAELYARAAERPGGPYFAGRIAAELWRRAGQRERAYRWLKRWYETLPADREEAQAELVLARIKALERELGLPEEARRH